MEDEKNLTVGPKVQDDWEQEIERLPFFIRLIVRGLTPVGDMIAYLLDGGNIRESGKAPEKRHHDHTR